MPLPCNPTYIYGSIVVGGIPRWIGVSVKIALKINFHIGSTAKNDIHPQYSPTTSVDIKVPNPMEAKQKPKY